MSLPRKNEYYTYSDYCLWDETGRWELIEGIPYAMSPAPSTRHQEISGGLHRELAAFLKGKACKVFHAPFDVRLNAAGEDDTVVQPDLVVICDRSKIDDRGCKGAPDMIIEIISPSSARHDRFIKFQLYQKFGVREYWIVDPDTNTVAAHVLKNDVYTTRVYGDTDAIPVNALSDYTIDLREIFNE